MTMKKNAKLTSVMKQLVLAIVVSFTFTSCVGYYYADGIYNDPVPERPLYVEREMPPQRYDYPPENRYADNGYNSYFRDKAKQYENPAVDSSFTHFTDVNSYRSNAYASGTSSYGGWGSNPSQVNVNVYNRGWANPYYGYYAYPYYRSYRSGWSLSLGWGSYYDPYWDNYYYGGYYPYYGYDPYYSYYSYYGYYPYYGYSYGYYPYYGYPYGYYPYYRGYYDYYYRPRDYYYEPGGSYGREYSGRGRAIIRDDNYRSNANRYEEGRGSYNRSQSQGYYNNNTNYSGRPSYQSQQQYNTPPTGYENRRNYDSMNSGMNSGRSSNYGNSGSGNYSSGGGNYSSGSSSNEGYRSSNRR